MAKAELTWEKSNVRPAKVLGNANRTADFDRGSDRPTLGLAIVPTIEVREIALTRAQLMSAFLEQEATDYAIAAMCGEVKWGAC